MNLTELIKTYGEGKGEKAIWAVTDTLSDFLKDNLSDDSYEKLCKELYYKMAGGHFNKDFADIQIPQMYYEADGEKVYAPYWTESDVKEVYSRNKNDIPDEYNFYDFEVTLNMVKSDYCPLLKKWYKETHSSVDEDACKKWCFTKIVELAVNWLKDDDNPFGTEKIWKYFNS